MNEALLIVMVIAVFVFGFFVVGRVDKFLDKNCKSSQAKYKTKEPSYVMLTDELSEEEIEKEIRRFKERHAHTRVILCDADDPHFPQDADR